VTDGDSHIPHSQLHASIWQSFLRRYPTLAMLASEAQHSLSDGTLSSALVPVIYIRSVPSNNYVGVGFNTSHARAGAYIHVRFGYSG
jgi:hypothetical protein